MTTRLAPAVRCLAASSRFVNRPVDSNTTSTPRSFQGSCAGSRIDKTLKASPSTEIPSPDTSTFACKLPSTESYLSKCASVAALVRSFTATKSMFASPSAVRYKKYVGSLGQRLGYLPITLNVDGDESIWIHAVSVGEALTARALVADLKARYPRLRLYLSTTTIAGQEVAKKNL